MRGKRSLESHERPARRGRSCAPGRNADRLSAKASELIKFSTGPSELPGRDRRPPTRVTQAVGGGFRRIRSRQGQGPPCRRQPGNGGGMLIHPPARARCEPASWGIPEGPCAGSGESRTGPRASRDPRSGACRHANTTWSPPHRGAVAGRAWADGGQSDAGPARAPTRRASVDAPVHRRERSGCHAFGSMGPGDAPAPARSGEDADGMHREAVDIEAVRRHRRDGAPVASTIFEVAPWKRGHVDGQRGCTGCAPRTASVHLSTPRGRHLAARDRSGFFPALAQ